MSSSRGGNGELGGATLENKNSDVLPVIDWEGCLNCFEGNEQTTRDMLAMMQDDAKRAELALEQAYERRDIKVLREELHRCLGGVVYLKLPQFESTIRDFQTAIKAEKQDLELQDKLYGELRSAIKNFLSACEQL